jgi:hypothetical protein
LGSTDEVDSSAVQAELFGAERSKVAGATSCGEAVT